MTKKKMFTKLKQSNKKWKKIILITQDLILFFQIIIKV